MNDERVGRGPSLCGKDSRACSFRQRVRREPVDGFGGHAYDLTPAQGRRDAGQVKGSWPQYMGSLLEYGHKKTGAAGRGPGLEITPNLLGEQHGPAALDRLGDAALLLGGEMGVFPGKDLSGIGDIPNHQLGLGERERLGSEGLGCGGLGDAHC